MDDLISRETMKDLIDTTTWYHQNRNKDMVEGAPDEGTAWFKAEDVYKAIENVPTAQRTGRWIDGKVKHIKNGELRNVRECSECGSSYFVYDYYNSVDETPKFCPNCGAKMKGEWE